MWLQFLYHPTVYSRPFVDFSTELLATEVDMTSDASANPVLGMGATCQNSWMFQQWNKEFIEQCKPSIEYLELYALIAGVMRWAYKFRNRQIILFCNNQSVVDIVNATSSSCKQCMVLVRLLVLHSLTENVRIFARHIKGVDNYFSDCLSRLKLSKFKQLVKDFNKEFDNNPTELLAQL